ncbi:MAG: NAD(P)-dependent oxidoreductase [Thaumarchaeota archaeon]|nr:NAD(P)-dependent oxidoreductase [Nitrososphaerota archaeon]
MKVLLTGSNGFVGRFVAERLGRGLEVRGVDLPTDLTVKENALKAVEDMDAVVHLAALAGASGKGGAAESRDNPYPFLHNNINATLNVLEAMKVHRVDKLVFMSSFSVYPRSPKCPIDEDTPVGPYNAYGKSKQVGEELVRFYSQFGIRSAILRPTLICGEHQREKNAVREFVISAIEGQPIEIWGEGLHRREFIHPVDIAEAIWKSLKFVSGKMQGEYETFVLGNQPVSMLELAKLVKARIPETRIEFRPPGPQAFDQTTDHSKAIRILGWEPSMGIDEILSKVILDVRMGMKP